MSNSLPQNHHTGDLRFNQWSIAFFLKVFYHMILIKNWYDIFNFWQYLSYKRICNSTVKSGKLKCFYQKGYWLGNRDDKNCIKIRHTIEEKGQNH